MPSFPAALRGSLLLALGLCPPLAAQGTANLPGPFRAELLSKGIAADHLRPREAADAFEALVARDSLDAEANWRAAIALVDIGKRTPDDRKDPVRDSLYLVSERYARRAVRLAPTDANAWFALALALGKTALSKGQRERVKYALEIRNAAVQSVALDPSHDGAYHILGRWHAEVERLSNLEEFFAKKFLGAKAFGEASYEEAARNLERAVELRPGYIFHRLDLALVYVDMKRYREARQELDAIAVAPTLDAMDPEYRRQAAALRARIAGKR